MKSLAIGSLAAAIAMFIWGFIFWAGGIGSAAFERMSLDQEAAVAEALVTTLPADGAYVLPGIDNGTEESFAARMRSGPQAMIHFHRAGMPPMDPMVLLGGFLHMLLSVVILGLVLYSIRDRVPAFGDRAKVAVLVALTAAVFANLGNPIWFHQSWMHHIMIAVYDFVALALAGLILAWLLKPRVTT